LGKILSDVKLRGASIKTLRIRFPNIGTKLKKRTMKIRGLLLIICLFTYCDGFSQITRLALSPLQTLQQKIGKTEITITYSRPAKRGRTIFGGLVPYEELWRTGANRNSKIAFSEEVIIEGTRIEKGTYAIFTKPSKTHWEVYLYTDTSNWDVPTDWDQEKVAVQIRVPAYSLERPLSSLTISVDEVTNDQFNLSIAWDQTGISFPISLSTEEQMLEDIADVLGGPDADDYYLAAQYRLESGRELEKAVEWSSKAIELRPKSAWWDYRIKCLAMLELGEKEAVQPFAQKGYELAQVHGSDYGISELKSIVERCK